MSISKIIFNLFHCDIIHYFCDIIGLIVDNIVIFLIYHVERVLSI